MSEEKGNAEKKKKDFKSANKKKIVVVSLFLIGVITVFFVYSYFDAFISRQAKKDMPVDEGVVISSDTANGFPVTFTSDDIISVDNVSTNMIVLTKKMLTSITGKGKVKYLSSFTYVEPTMISGSKYGIVYDRASSKYMLFDKNKVLSNSETADKNNIITASINDDGTYVLVTKSNKAACSVNVYDKRGELLYSWLCSDEYVVSVDISNNSQDIICAGIGASDGVIYTKIYHLNIFEKKHVSEHIIEGSSVVDVKISTGDNIIATCDNSRLIIDISVKNSKPVSVKYPSQALACDSNESGYTAILNHKLGSFDKKQITLYDKKNKAVYICDVDAQVSDIICKGKKVYLLTDKSIIEVSSGESRVLAETDIKGAGMVVCENKLYYYSTSSLRTGK